MDERLRDAIFRKIPQGTTIAKKSDSVGETLQTAECDQELHKLVLGFCHEQRGLEHTWAGPNTEMPTVSPSPGTTYAGYRKAEKKVTVTFVRCDWRLCSHVFHLM